MKKKSLPTKSAINRSPSRSTGNKFIFRAAQRISLKAGPVGLT